MKFKIFLIVLLIILSFFTMMSIVIELPVYGEKDNPIHNEVYRRYIDDQMEETGVPNMVTSIVLDYRAYDTMFETIVLFAAATAVTVALKATKKGGDDK